jgi:ketosteroid isomerase-like protein
MRKFVTCSLLAPVVVALAACAPSPAEVAQQYAAAVSAKNVPAVLALIAPNAEGDLNIVTQHWLNKNAKIEVTGKYKIDGKNVVADARVINDEYVRLGVAPVDALFEATAVKGQLISAKLSLTAEAQARVDGAIAALTKKVVDDFEAAVNAKNYDAALALVSDNVTFTGVDGKNYTGKAELRAQLEAGLSFEKSDYTVAGSKVTWKTGITMTELAKLNIAPLEADAQATVEGGKVKALTLAFTPEATTKLADAKTPGKKKTK